MANIYDYISKNAKEIVDEFLARLDEFINDHNSTTSKTRDNLLNCIESNKKNNLNSKKRCEETLLELDNQIRALGPKYAAENDKIQEKNDARLKSNNDSIKDFKDIYKS